MIVLAAWLNVALRVRFSTTQRLPPDRAAWLFAFDIAEIAVLLFLTGGLQNPFSFLLLGPVLLAATSLPPRMIVILGGFAAICTTVLAFYYYPLPWDADERPMQLPAVYIAGIWIATLLSIGFIGVHAWQLTEEARQMSNALAATELVLAREQHLSQLDGLAAAAAHELGTPLSTITVIAKELERAIEKDSPLADDIALLREQAQRCRQILGKLTELSSNSEPFDRMPLSALIEEVVAPHRNFGVAINVALTPDGAAEPVGGRNPAILYGLGNLVENAVDFARGTVEVAADWSGEAVSVTITDDGPGFAPEIMDRIGDPYVTSRPAAADERRRRSRRRTGARFFHRQDAARARGRDAGIREPRGTRARRNRAGALGPRRFRAATGVSVLARACSTASRVPWNKSTQSKLSGIYLGARLSWPPHREYIEFTSREWLRTSRLDLQILSLVPFCIRRRDTGGGAMAGVGEGQWPRRGREPSVTPAGDRTLLIVEDDKSFLQRLARAMEGRGFTVTTAESVAEGLIQLETASPAFAVVDMRLGDGNGLDVISALKRRRPDARAIILTGYGNIATAVNGGEARRGRLSRQAGGRRRRGQCAARTRRQDRRAAGKSDVGRSRPLGAHPAHLRIVQPQRLGDRAPAQHAPPHAPAHPGEARAEVSRADTLRPPDPNARSLDSRTRQRVRAQRRVRCYGPRQS